MSNTKKNASSATFTAEPKPVKNNKKFSLANFGVYKHIRESKGHRQSLSTVSDL